MPTDPAMIATAGDAIQPAEGAADGEESGSKLSFQQPGALMNAAALIKVIGHYALGLVVALLTVWAAGTVLQSGGQALAVARDGEVIDLQTLFDLLQVVLGCVAIVAAWHFVFRRKLSLAAAVLLLAIPVPVLVAFNFECDFDCKDLRWATLPQPLLHWRVRIRPPPRWTPPPIVRQLTTHLKIHPAGATVPKSFLDQANASDIGGVSSCFLESGDATCDVYVLDVFGTGVANVLTVSPNDQHDHYLAAELFSQGRGGTWRRTGELTVTCNASMQAFREGRFQLAPSKTSDVVLAGRQFSLLLDPDYGCPELGGKVPPLHQ
jgi:hypothetical protein